MLQAVFRVLHGHIPAKHCSNSSFQAEQPQLALEIQRLCCPFMVFAPEPHRSPLVHQGTSPFVTQTQILTSCTLGDRRTHSGASDTTSTSPRAQFRTETGPVPWSVSLRTHLCHALDEPNTISTIACTSRAGPRSDGQFRWCIGSSSAPSGSLVSQGVTAPKLCNNAPLPHDNETHCILSVLLYANMRMSYSTIVWSKNDTCVDAHVADSCKGKWLFLFLSDFTCILIFIVIFSLQEVRTRATSTSPVTLAVPSLSRCRYHHLHIVLVLVLYADTGVGWKTSQPWHTAQHRRVDQLAAGTC